jgi:hypothetical protein
MNEFTQNIKSWVHYDNEIHKLNQTLKELRLKKCEMQNVLLDNPSHDTINISDGRLKFSQINVIQPLSLQFISACLTELICDSEQVNQIMDHVKMKRNKKTELTIKRFYNK